MDIKIIDYDKFTQNDIKMRQSEWDKVKSHTDEEVLRVHWESLVWPEGYPDCLKNMPVEKQIEYYAVKESSEYVRTSYGEIDKENFMSYGYVPLKDYKRFEGVIVKEGTVVGAIISNYYGNIEYLYPGKTSCIYWSIDSDGTGSSSSDVYVSMYCLPVDNE